MKPEALQTFIRNEIASFLRETRIEAGLFIKEAADKLDCTPSELEKYEAGTETILTFEILRIAKLYQGTETSAARFLQGLSDEVETIMRSAQDSEN